MLNWKSDWRKTEGSQRLRFKSKQEADSKGSLKKSLPNLTILNYSNVSHDVELKINLRRIEGSQRLRFMSKQESSKVEELDKKYFCLQFHFVWCQIDFFEDLYKLDERSQPTKTFSNLYGYIFRHFSCPCQFKVQNTTDGK